MEAGPLQHLLYSLHSHWHTLISPMPLPESVPLHCSFDTREFSGILGSYAHISNFLESLTSAQRKREGGRNCRTSWFAKGRSRPVFAGIFSSMDGHSSNSSSSATVDALTDHAVKALGSFETSQVLDTDVENVKTAPFLNAANSHMQTQLTRKMDFGAAPVSKEELGRATWTLLHTIAAQFPDKPTKQQQRDVKDLMAILSRIYPCKQCADHFKEVLKANPVQAASGLELAQWMCRVHNIVNRSLGKPIFPCQRVDARWGALDCDEGACDLQGRMYR